MRKSRLVAVSAVAFAMMVANSLLTADESVAPKELNRWQDQYVPAPPGPYASQQTLEQSRETERSTGSNTMGMMYGERRPYFGPGRYWSDDDWAKRRQEFMERRNAVMQQRAPWGSRAVEDEEKAEEAKRETFRGNYYRQPMMPPPAYMMPPNPAYSPYGYAPYGYRR